MYIDNKFTYIIDIQHQTWVVTSKSAEQQHIDLSTKIGNDRCMSQQE